MSYLYEFRYSVWESDLCRVPTIKEAESQKAMNPMNLTVMLKYNLISISVCHKLMHTKKSRFQTPFFFVEHNFMF